MHVRHRSCNAEIMTANGPSEAMKKLQTVDTAGKSCRVFSCTLLGFLLEILADES